MLNEIRKLLRSRIVLTLLIAVIALSVYEGAAYGRRQIKSGEIFSDTDVYLTQELYQSVTQTVDEIFSAFDFSQMYYIEAIGKAYPAGEIMRLSNSVRNAIQVERQRQFAMELALFNIREIEERGERGYWLRYNRMVYEHYLYLPEPHLMETLTWESLLARISNELEVWNKWYILPMLAAMMASATLFAMEHESSVYLIVHASRNGRSCLYMKKICAIFIFSLFLTALYWLIWWIWNIDSFSSNKWLSAPIQSIPGLELCPFSITLPQTMLLIIGIQTLLTLFLCLLSACGALLTQNRFAGFCVAIAVFGVLFAWYYAAASMHDVTNPFYRITQGQIQFRQISQIWNPIYLISPGMYLNNFKMVNIAGLPIPMLFAPSAVALVATALLSVWGKMLSAGRKYKPKTLIEVTQ
ncbi:MAG: hypothetical protein FWH17_09365 [Oscillospiraceae bacterium]|nr:hypothetical protein [Oscillospiraceae bacterium]